MPPEMDDNRLTIRQELNEMKQSFTKLAEAIQPLINLIQLVPPEQWFKGIREQTEANEQLKARVERLEANTVRKDKLEEVQAEGKKWRIGIIISGTSSAIAVVLWIVAHLQIVP